MTGKPNLADSENAALRTELEELRRQYADLYDLAPIGYLRFNRDGRIQDANATAAAMLNATSASLQNQTFARYLVDDDVPLFRRHLQELWRCGARQSCELRLKGEKPHIVHMESTRAETANALCCHTSMVDISARFDAEQRAHNSERQLRLLFENATDYAIFMLDEEGFITDWNIGAERILGYRDDEAIGRPGAIIFTPEDRHMGVVEQETAVARANHCATDERWHVRKDGSRFWASGIMIALRDERGNLFGYAKVLRDFTERKIAAEERERLLHDLETEHAQLQAIVRQMPAGVVIVNADGKLILRNAQAEALLGYIVDDTSLGALHKMHRIYRPDGETYATTDRPLARALRGEVVVDEEADYDRADGRRGTLSVHAAPIYNRAGVIAAAVATFSDITDRRLMQGETLKASKLESIGLLAGGIAHDFNNLLTGVIGNLYLTRLALDPHHEAQETLTEAERACRRAASLTQQLLTFSTGGEPIKKRVAAAPLLQETAHFAARGAGVHCEIHIAEDLWAVEVDEGQISQVINNLIINAQQAMPDGGKVFFRAANVHVGEERTLPLNTGDYVQIQVEDEGVGIPEDKRNKVFDPFFTTKLKGTGLGLTSAYWIVQKHHGYIGVEPREPKGTRFSVYLPAFAEGRPSKDVSLPTPSVGGTRILIMDDEPVIRRFLERILQHFGYDVVAVEEGGVAVEQYRAALASGRRFDVVMLDLTIPNGMGGKETMQRLRAIDPNVLAVVSSGYSTDPVMAQFRDFGFSATVAKPYQVEELRAKLAEVLQTAQATS